MNTLDSTAADPVMLFVALVVLLLPPIVAQIRKHHNQNAIGIVTLISGLVAFFSFQAGACVWLFALVWSFMNPAPKSGDTKAE